jgi:hypothetical protein
MTTIEAQRAARLENGRRRARLSADEVLNPGERMIWSGYCESRVGQQSKTVSGDENKVVQMFIACLIVVAGVGGALSTILVPALGIGIGIVAGGIFLWKIAPRMEWGTDSKMYCRQQTFYALTNERALVVRNCNQGVPVRSVPWRFIDHVRVVGERWDGRGTVEFWSWDASTHKWACSLRFLMIEQPNRVLEHVEALASGRE